MKPFWMALIAASVAASAYAQPSVPARPGSAPPGPADSGRESKPDSPVKPPQQSGMVVEPPGTGSGAEIVKTPPVTGDPEIDDATKGIDKKNREELQDKPKKHSR